MQEECTDTTSTESFKGDPTQGDGIPMLSVSDVLTLENNDLMSLYNGAMSPDPANDSNESEEDENEGSGTKTQREKSMEAQEADQTFIKTAQSVMTPALEKDIQSTINKEIMANRRRPRNIFETSLIDLMGTSPIEVPPITFVPVATTNRKCGDNTSTTDTPGKSSGSDSELGNCASVKSMRLPTKPVGYTSSGDSVLEDCTTTGLDTGSVCSRSMRLPTKAVSYTSPADSQMDDRPSDNPPHSSGNTIVDSLNCTTQMREMFNISPRPVIGKTISKSQIHSYNSDEEEASDDSCSVTEDEFDVDDLDDDIFPNELSLSQFPIRFRKEQWSCKICFKVVLVLDELLTHVLLTHTEAAATENVLKVGSSRKVFSPLRVLKINRDKEAPENIVPVEKSNEADETAIDKIETPANGPIKKRKSTEDIPIAKRLHTPLDAADCFIDLTSDDEVESDSKLSVSGVEFLENNLHYKDASDVIDLTDDPPEEVLTIAGLDGNEAIVSTEGPAPTSQPPSALTPKLNDNESSRISMVSVIAACSMDDDHDHKSSNSAEPSSSRQILMDYEQDTYKCSKCGVGVDSVQGLADHIMTHLKPVTVKVHKAYHACQQCGKTFREVSNFKDHMAQHKGIKPYKCKLCPKSFHFPSLLSKHMQDHSFVSKEEQQDGGVQSKVLHSQGTDSQSQNLKYTITQGKVMLPLGSQSQEDTPQFKIPAPPKKQTILGNALVGDQTGKVICSMCGLSFAKMSVLKAHMDTHLGRTPILPKPNEKISGLHPCQLCGVVFTSAFQLGGHMGIHRDKKNTDQQKRDRNKKIPQEEDTSHLPHKCKVCDKGFDHPKKLQGHMWGKHRNDNRPFKCKICQKHFETNCLLDEHISSHKDDDKDYDPTMYSCLMCDKILKSHSGFKSHMKTQHADQMPFSCEMCGERFLTSEKLSDHVNSLHAEVVSHDRMLKTCEICWQTFSNQQQLSGHMRKHQSDGSLECPICRHKCKSKAEMDSHVETHTVIN